MIPLKDNISSRTLPIINFLLIFTNISFFIYELSLQNKVNNLIYTYGLIPYRITHFSFSSGLTLKDIFLPFISSLFLHGGWVHLIGNMLYLWVFGDNIEDKLGHLKYLVFYLLCGIIASLCHIFFTPNSSIVCIGASGAIAGVLGAYFINFPKAKILTLVPLWFFLRIVEIPSFIVLSVWFFIQCLNGTARITSFTSGIAWWAHIGGFIAGVILSQFFKRKK